MRCPPVNQVTEDEIKPAAFPAITISIWALLKQSLMFKFGLVLKV